VPFDFIWFDLGNTLLHRDREGLFAGLLERTTGGMPIGEIEKAFHLTDKRFMRDFPGLLARPVEEFLPLYFDILCRNLGVGGDLVALLGAWMSAWKSGELVWRPFPCVADVLGRLASDGMRLGIISNWDTGATQLLAGLGLLDRFEVVIISSEVGVSKPDKGIFRIALEKAAVGADRCLYVGDNYYDDTLGAAKVGMRSLIVNRFGSLGVEELRGQRFIADISEVIPFLEEGTSCPVAIAKTGLAPVNARSEA